MPMDGPGWARALVSTAETPTVARGVSSAFSFLGDTKIVLAILVDSRGLVWVSSSAGVSRLENGRWRQFETADGLLQDSVTYLTEALDHAVWVGYRDPIGISRLEIDGDRLHSRHFGPKDGLPAARTYFLRFDRRGWLWVGSDMGVDRYDGKAWRHTPIRPTD